MNLLKIAFLQIAPGDTPEETLQKGLACCRRAGALGADIALFPEMWSSGYRLDGTPLGLDSPFVRAFGALARELSMAVAVTLLEEHPQGPRNTLVLFDRHGVRKLVYAKVHTCDFEEERILTPGEDFYTTDLDTARGGGSGGRHDLL